MNTAKEETRLLLAELKKCHEKGLTATYQQLEKVVSGCATRKRGCLVSALNIAKRDYGMLFICLSRIGYQPIENESKVSQIELRRLGKIQSQVKRMEQELDTVSVATLPTIEQQRYYSAQIKMTFHKMVADEQLHSSFAIAAQKCCNSGKIEFSSDDFKTALQALS